jgi:hypothetical protein
MTTKSITSLYTNFAILPGMGFDRYPTGLGTITNLHMAFQYVSILFFKVHRTLANSDIETYYQPFTSILYLDYHKSRYPKIVKIGSNFYSDQQITDISVINKALKELMV